MATTRKVDVETHVVINDIHVPFHDQEVFEAFFAWCKDIKPDVVHINGDFIDFPQISKYDKDPERLLHLQDDIDVGIEVLTEIRKYNPNARIIFHDGNHEARLYKYKWKNPELARLRDFSIPGLLKLKEHNMEYLKYNQPFIWKNTFVITHGTVVRQHGSYSAKGELEKWGMSGISGHCFDEETEVLTLRGWVKGFDLCPEDLVGTMNFNTRCFQWNQINQFHSYDTFKELVHIKNMTTDLAVTKDHGMIVCNRNTRELKKISAKDLFDLKGDWELFNAIPSPESKEEYPHEDLTRILVWIVADGSFDDKRVRFHLKKQRKIFALVKLLERLGWRYRMGKIGKTGSLKTTVWLPEGFKEHYFPEKKILGEWILEHNPFTVLQEYSITDGCKNKSSKNSYQLSSIKESEIDLLQQLFVIGGMRCTKIKRKDKHHFILTVNTRNSILLNPSQLSIKDYSGKVWCVNVDNGTLLVRRKGKVCITQNTHRLGSHYKTDRGGDKAWFENGCMCMKDKVDYMNGKPNWQHGFSVIFFNKKSKRFYVQQVPIANKAFMYNGRYYGK